MVAHGLGVCHSLFAEQIVQIAEGLEFQRVARRVEQEHRGLFTRQTGESHVRLDDKRYVSLFEAICQRFPVGPRQNDAKVGYGHGLPIHRIVVRVDSLRSWYQVSDDLVAVEIEVDPVIITPSLGTLQQFSVELPSGRKVVNGKRKVKRWDGHLVDRKSGRLSLKHSLDRWAVENVFRVNDILPGDVIVPSPPRQDVARSLTDPARERARVG
jgi:hypothetical protein